eukprot:scaffold24053_cov55-Phaeocystis_antarctica.AAC.2
MDCWDLLTATDFKRIPIHVLTVSIRVGVTVTVGTGVGVPFRAGPTRAHTTARAAYMYEGHVHVCACACTPHHKGFGPSRRVRCPKNVPICRDPKNVPICARLVPSENLEEVDELCVLCTRRGGRGRGRDRDRGQGRGGVRAELGHGLWVPSVMIIPSGAAPLPGSTGNRTA